VPRVSRKRPEDRVIAVCETLRDKLLTHQKNMAEIQKEDRIKNDIFVLGYNAGIQDGLEAAINIIKKFEELQYKNIRDFYAKQARKELAKK
jgi:hypothetical protein